MEGLSPLTGEMGEFRNYVARVLTPLLLASAPPATISKYGQPPGHCIFLLARPFLIDSRIGFNIMVVIGSRLITHARPLHWATAQAYNHNAVIQ